MPIFSGDESCYKGQKLKGSLGDNPSKIFTKVKATTPERIQTKTHLNKDRKGLLCSQNKPQG